MAKGKKKAQEEKEAKAQQKILERQQVLEELRQFIDFSIQKNEEKMQTDARHHEVRMIQLQNSINKFLALDKLMMDEELEARHLREWKLYTKDDRLPNPPIVPEMNTYLHRWHIDDSTYQIENIPKKTDEVLLLLHILEEFEDFPLQSDERLIQNWKEVHNHLCSELRHHFDVATYRILCFVEDKMVRNGLNEYRFAMDADNFNIHLWTMLPLPTPMIPPNLTPKDCNFPQIGVSLTIPNYLLKFDLVVRGLYVNYDHFSSLSNTNSAIPLPEEMIQDLVKRAEIERAYTIKFQNEEVNVKLQKLNELRRVLISQAEEFNIEIIEFEATKAAGKDKAKKKKKIGPEEEEKLKAIKKQEERIQNLMKELNIDNLSVSMSSGSKAMSTIAKDDDSSRKSEISKKPGRKKGGPEKEFWNIIDKIKNLPLHKSASTIFGEKEEIEDFHIRDKLCVHHEPDELNLRKYAIIGGVVQIDIIFILPQPYQHPEKYIISLINLPVGLEFISDKNLEPPEQEKKEEKSVALPRKSTLQHMASMMKSLSEFRASVELTDKDENEEDEKTDDTKDKDTSKKSKSRKSSMSTKSVAHTGQTKSVKMGRSTIRQSEEGRKMFKLTSMIDVLTEEGETERLQHPKLKVMLRDDVMYFDPPIIVQWDEENKYWCRSNCINVEILNKEVTFQVKKFGPLGFATYRYSNLPFKSWDLRPCHEDNSVELRIRAKHINVFFKIKNDEVCLVSVEKLPKHILQDVIGKYKRPRVLVKYLQNKGVDIFPSDDSHCYVKEIHSKHIGMEEHLYHCMAIASGVYNFCWSRWNMLQDRRKIVVLMREFLDRWHPVNPSTLLVTPLKVGIVDLTEWSPEFKEEFIPETKFYADLNSLLHDNMSLIIEKKLRDSSTTQIETVFDMLRRTKVISYTTSYPEKAKEPFVSYQVQPPVEEKKKKRQHKKKKEKKGKPREKKDKSNKK